jgi:hypothetical protein
MIDLSDGKVTDCIPAVLEIVQVPAAVRYAEHNLIFDPGVDDCPLKQLNAVVAAQLVWMCDLGPLWVEISDPDAHDLHTMPLCDTLP